MSVISLGSHPDPVRAGYDCLARGDLAGAMATCQALLAERPKDADAWNLAGLIAAPRGELSAAERFYARALDLDPAFIEALSNRGAVLSRMGRGDEALAAFDAALARRPADRAASYNRLLAALYVPSVSPQAGAQYHRRWGEELEAATPPLPIGTPRPRIGRALRVGYVSADFKRHSVAWFLAPILARHDRRRVTVYAYANLVGGDDVTAALRGDVDVWRSVKDLDDVRLARQILADRIDVLVDLSGHTVGNRLGVFAHRPAPVQITYLGYPATTGLSSIDYRLTDAWADPPGVTEHLHTEKLVRLEGGFLCYAPPSAPAVAPPPVLRRKGITFGSFNDAAKLSTAVLRLWARVLHGVRESRLVVKARALSDPGVRQRVVEVLGGAGIAAERIELRRWQENMSDHLAAYGDVDIGLDTVPYNGTTTTCEALWMGVPVVTLAGPAHVGRVGASLLSRVGLPELCATSDDEFVRIATNLAATSGRLATLRSSMRERLSQSPLLDAPGFVERLEDTYEALWDEKVAALTQVGRRAWHAEGALTGELDQPFSGTQ